MNIKTGSYSFETIDGEISSTGYLDEDRKNVADQISFNKQYEVIINRKSSEPIGRELKKQRYHSFFYGSPRGKST